MNLAARAKEIFESSEVDEKRQLLNFVFQNLKLEGKNLSIQTCEPFTTLMDYKQCPKGWGNLDLNQGPTGYESAALTTELLPQKMRSILRDFLCRLFNTCLVAQCFTVIIG